MQYRLKLKDKDILYFHIEKESYSLGTTTAHDYMVHIDSIIDPQLLPLGLTPTNTGLHQWLLERKIPKNRAYVDELLQALSETDNPYSYIDVSSGLSLNDTYWVCPVHEQATWQTMNLYTNPFDEIIARIAFTGYESKLHHITTTPEYTTNGMLKKCWHRMNSIIYLYKGSTHRFANGGQEAFIECYASQIAEAMEIPHVPYTIHTYHGEPVSACPLFTSEQVGFLPMSKYVDSVTTRDDLSRYRIQLEIGKRYGLTAFQDMMVFDAFIRNADRHLNNFGFLFHTESNELIGPAPLFDHGNSLFYNACDEDYDHLDSVNHNTSYWGISYEEQAKRFLQVHHIPMLEKMKTFTFNYVPSTILTEKKINALETFLQRRANLFLSFLSETIK